MTLRVAINGLGRIGRNIVRAYADRQNDIIQIVAANSPPASVDVHYHLLKYDSIHGTMKNIKKCNDHEIDVGKGPIKLLNISDPSKLPWGEMGIDVVLECSGLFREHAKASGHLTAGAKKVLVSAPSPDPDATIVYGVNHHELKPEHKVISIGSCTTNCLAPIVRTLHDAIGIERGFMTTIHSYTNDQNLTDNKHEDMQRARAATLSMIPSSTGAAKALSLVVPEMKGKMDGVSVRVPTPNVSLVDLTFTSSKPVTVEAINEALIQASKGKLRGIMAINDLPLVSIDFNSDPHSTIVDIKETRVVDKTFCRVAAWYDNEWGFSNRMLDITAMLGRK